MRGNLVPCRTVPAVSDVCDRHAAEPGRTALIYFDERGLEHRYAFNEIRDIANKLANALTALGIRRGDRVAILLPQSPETAITRSHQRAVRRSTHQASGER